MTLFEKTYQNLYKKLVLEAGEAPDMPPPDEGGEGGLNLPALSELEGDSGNQDTSQEAKPEEYELAKLAIKTLESVAIHKSKPI